MISYAINSSSYYQIHSSSHFFFSPSNTLSLRHSNTFSNSFSSTLYHSKKPKKQINKEINGFTISYDSNKSASSWTLPLDGYSVCVLALE